MNESPSTTGSEAALDALIAEYLQALEAGNAPSRDTFLARHRAHAESLRKFFHDFDALGRDASKFRLPPSSRTSETITHDRAVAVQTPKLQYLGDYELQSEIARGGMGVVYRAKQVSLNRPVAVKMILAGTYATPEAVQRFRAEAEAAANLDYPNILPIYEVGEHDGHQYFSMKLVEGGSLSSRIDELKSKPKQIAELMATLARAVHFAHQRGILHRDLKPANVLMDADGTPFITDFGLAKKVDADDGSTRTGSIIGTPSYMSPEQARGEKGLTTSVDIYSLGAILYEMLTGQPPFRGETIFETVKQVIEQEPKKPDGDRELGVIALKCLSKDTNKRYASAGEMAEDLDRWQRGEPILARDSTSLERATKWVRRNRGLAAGLAVAIATLLLGTIVSVGFGLKARREALAAAEQERQALIERERLQDTLCVCDYEEAKALRRAQAPGWRAKCLELLKTAAEVRGRVRSPHLAEPEIALPSWPELRGEAIESLAGIDVEAVQTFALPLTATPHLSGDGRTLLVNLPGLPGQEAGIQILVPRTMEEKRFHTIDQIIRGVGDIEIDVDMAFDLPFISAIDSTGSNILCETLDGKYRIRRLADYAVTHTLTDPERGNDDGKEITNSSYISPDGNHVLVETYRGGNRVLLLWSLDTPNKPTLIGSTKLIENDVYDRFAVSFSLDGSQLAIASLDSAVVKVFDLRTAGYPIKHEIPLPKVRRIAWHPNGKTLGLIVNVEGADVGQVVLWDLGSKTERTRGAKTDGIGLLAFSPDGRFLARSTYGVVRIHGADDVIERYRIYQTDMASLLSWTAESELMIATALDRMTLYRIIQDDLVKEIRTPKQIDGVAVSPDGRWLAYREIEQDSRIERGNRGSQVAAMRHLIRDANHARPQTIRLVERATGLVKRSWTGNGLPKGALVFRQDGSRLAFRTPDEILLWDTATGKELLRRRTDQSVQPAKGDDAPTALWDEVFFDESGRLLSIGAQGDDMNRLFVLYDLQSGKVLSRINMQAESLFPYHCISSNGRWLATFKNDFTNQDPTTAGRCRIVDLPRPARINLPGFVVLRRGNRDYSRSEASCL